ncbi:kinesin-like protein, putative [Leishmania donovani]|uniref:Kinesin-like protein, putative n=1 Tax=Leishmania donovani TaxID=5661 RepID=A0A3S7XBW9_LEIDO|nr:kinesin-like protein, putative [Leishmania donovani]
MTMSLKSSTCRSFVRVRPFTASEAKVCPEDSAIPRGILQWDGNNIISVLDPQNYFEVRRNAVFAVSEVLWSFQEPGEEALKSSNKKRPATQQDVYNRVVAPMIPAIVEGYNTAFCVAGASSSGRFYTLYGGEAEGAHRGILPRFAEDIISSFKMNAQTNSSLSVELEAVDISGETYVDLLATGRHGGSIQTSADSLKLLSTPSGPRLVGVNSVDADSTPELLKVIQQLYRIVEKRNSTHTVSFRFTETFEFEDPENVNQSVSKSRRVQVLFVLLRNMPSAFQRCIDVAVEYDSGENPLAKVPVRESAFTKLFPSLLQQGFHLNMISCVSPYYEHMREDINTLQFSVKVKKLKGNPQLLHDESFVEMRRLADEVKDLQVEERKTHEALSVVQNELNVREVELMKQEANYNKTTNEITESHKQVKLATIGRNMEAERSNRARKQMNTELNKKRAEIKEFQQMQMSLDAASKRQMRDADDAKVRAEAVETMLKKQKANTAIYEERLNEYREEDRKTESIEAFNVASPDEQRRMLISESDEKKNADAEIQRIERERSTARELDKTEERMRAIQAEYDIAYKAAAPSREKAELEEEIAKYEKEISETQSEIRRLQDEIDKKKSQCQCNLM